MGSAKDVYVITKPSDEKTGIGAFKFSDRYSVFDWGEMPDTIPDKGKALCMISAYMFEEAERKGFNTHYRGIVGNGKLLKANESDEPLDVMEFDMVRVIKPRFNNGAYDYSAIQKEKLNFLIPLEIIYRNSIPEGSSIFKRLKKGEINPNDIGLNHYPVPGEVLENPIFDVSTKLESRDRYITWEEAKQISGMGENKIEEIFLTAKNANEIISSACSISMISNEDGKIEFAVDSNGKLMIADVFGTPDECRFMLKGMNMSKEIARQYYKGTDWANEVERAKEVANSSGIENWRNLCSKKPDKLDREILEIISSVYTSIANEFIGKNIFDSPRTYEVVEQYKDWLDAIDTD